MRFRNACFLAVGLLPLAIAISASCSAGTKNSGVLGGGGAGGAGGGTGASSTGGTLVTGGTGQGGFGGGNAGSGGVDQDAACAAVSSEATAKLQPADILIAVDTSGSMDQEIQEVQNHLNDFATTITNS